MGHEDFCDGAFAKKNSYVEIYNRDGRLNILKFFLKYLGWDLINLTKCVVLLYLRQLSCDSVYAAGLMKFDHEQGFEGCKNPLGVWTGRERPRRKKCEDSYWSSS